MEQWYLVSASTSRDLLTLWRSYGAGASYAIGFDSAIKLHPIEHVAGEAHPSPPPGFYDDAYEEIDGRTERLYDPDGVGVLGGSWRTVTTLTRRVKPVTKTRSAPSRIEGSRQPRQGATLSTWACSLRVT